MGNFVGSDIFFYMVSFFDPRTLKKIYTKFPDFNKILKKSENIGYLASQNRIYTKCNSISQYCLEYMIKYYPQKSGADCITIVNRIIDNDDTEALNIFVADSHRKSYSISDTLKYHGIFRCIKENKNNIINKIDKDNNIDCYAIYEKGIIPITSKDYCIIIFLLIVGGHSKLLMTLDWKQICHNHICNNISKAIAEGLTHTNLSAKKCIEIYWDLLNVIRCRKFCGYSFENLANSFIDRGDIEGIINLYNDCKIGMDIKLDQNNIKFYRAFEFLGRYGMRHIFGKVPPIDKRLNYNLSFWEYSESLLDIIIYKHNKLISKNSKMSYADKSLLVDMFIDPWLFEHLLNTKDLYALKYLYDNNLVNFNDSNWRGHLSPKYQHMSEYSDIFEWSVL
jgi:hypothetical protein